MNQIVVFGGSNGLGAAIVARMLKLSPEAKIIVVDACPLSYENSRVRLVRADFSKKYRIEDFYFPEADAVVYTAGLGRIDRFEDFGKPETDKYFRVNATTPIELIELYSKKLLVKKDFHFGVVTSIAALVGSPLFAIYSATKAALSKYAEAVNVELEKAGTANRILDYCPGFIKGSNFYGLGNQPDELEKYAEDFVDCLLRGDAFRMALGDETYEKVLARYRKDPHTFGLESYDYKMSGGRLNPSPKIKAGYLSGTFDLFHIGHLNILKNAKSQCDYLVVGVHTSGKFKGKETFIPLEERKAIVEGISYVDEVVDAPDDDMDYVLKHQPDFLFVGSDYKGSERFNRYEEILKDKKTKIIYFPYTKGTSSTKLRSALDAIKKQ
jgi:glycerol-3-phosphate cytidylyltransferase